VRATGSNIPTFDDVPGTKMTFPDGRRTPPWKKLEVFAYVVTGPMFDEVPAVGLMTRTFEAFGTATTFPFGARTKPAYPSLPIEMLDRTKVTGSNCVMFDEPCTLNMTFPDGRRSEPV
jgi:hypothetical protein